MPSVIHLRKQLSMPPAATLAASVVVRHFHLPDDVAAWLALRERAMAGLVPGVRSWTADDFQVEMLAKPWWRADRTWLAFGEDSPTTLVGAVTLALREGAAHTVPVVHWLLVDPARRRRGIGRLLMARLERAAWGDGRREVHIETHAGWAAAVAFYQSLGYEPLREPPR